MLARWRHDRAIAVVAAVVLLVYVVSRVGLIGRFPPFVDEAEYADWSLGVFRDPLHPMLSLRFGKEPLITWLSALPIGVGFNPLTAIRLVSAVSGLVAAVAVGLLAGRLAGRWAGMSAAGVYAVMPFPFVQTTIGLYEPLVTALLCTALYLQLELARRPRRGVGLLLGVVMGAGLLAKDTGKLAVFLLPLTAICIGWAAWGRREARAWVEAALLALLITGAAYALLVVSPGFEELKGLRNVVLRSYQSGLGHPFHWIATNWGEDSDTLRGYLTLPILALVPVGLLAAMRRSPGESVVVLTWMVATWLAVVLLALTQFPRYFAPFAAVAAVFAGVGLWSVVSWVTARVPKPRLGAALGSAVAVALLWPAVRFDATVLADPGDARYPGGDYSQYVSSNFAGTGWRQIAGELRRRLPAHAAVVLYQGPWNWALPLLTEGREAPVEQSYANNIYASRRVRYIPADPLPTDIGSGRGEKRVFIVLNGNYELPPGLASQVRLVRDFLRPKEGIHLYLYEQA